MREPHADAPCTALRDAALCLARLASGTLCCIVVAFIVQVTPLEFLCQVLQAWALVSFQQGLPSMHSLTGMCV